MQANPPNAYVGWAAALSRPDGYASRTGRELQVACRRLRRRIVLQPLFVASAMHSVMLDLPAHKLWPALRRLHPGRTPLLETPALSRRRERSLLLHAPLLPTARWFVPAPRHSKKARMAARHARPQRAHGRAPLA